MKKHDTVADLLRCAKRLIVKGWSKGSYARTKKGTVCDLQSRSAAKFCMSGALTRCGTYSPLHWPARDIMNRVVKRGMPSFNDAPSTTKSMALAKFDEAIRLAEKTQS